MITWVRTAEIRDGKRLEAVQWALKTAAYVNETFDLNVTVQSNVSGQLNQLHWVATYESMADFEEASSKIFEDAGYQQLAREATEQQLYFGSSLNDSFYRTIG
jgi:hypothetical protein